MNDRPGGAAGPAVDAATGAGGGSLRLAVVIPCYRVRAQIDGVLAAIPPQVTAVYCVDDACPEGSGDHVEQTCRDPRVRVLRHAQNRGVGGAMVTGYRAALDDGAEIVVKLDGDGQMDPALMPRFVAPIAEGRCDYTKGNRFHRPQGVAGMPALRLIGNAALSFMTKLSSGYWHVFDPNNGYTAVHAAVLRMIPLDRLAAGYFFEADMLFRLSTVRAVVSDVPMDAVYGEERSNLRIARVALPFLRGHVVNFNKRIVYSYFLRDFHVASVEWLLGPLLLAFGVVFGLAHWLHSAYSGEPATAGTVMLSALPILIGFQLLLSALNFDIQNVPRQPVHRDLQWLYGTGHAGTDTRPQPGRD